MNPHDVVDVAAGEETRSPSAHATAEATEPSRRRWTVRFQSVPVTQELGLIIAVVVFGAFVTLINPVFLDPGNVTAILRSAVFVFIVGCAATFVLIGGGLDLSVGSVLAAGGATSATLLVAGVPTPVAFAAGIGIGALIGLMNGVLIIKFGIPALIVTLGMLYIARGLTQFVTGGVLISIGKYQGFADIAQGNFFGIPYLIIWAVTFGVASHFVLEHTPFGYHVRATGGNLSAANALGLRVDPIRMILYVFSGAAAGLAGALMAGRLETGDPNIAAGFELSVISGVIIGGTSLFGGLGSIVGTALGALLLSMMSNGLIIMRLNPLLQQVAVGMVIIAAVGIDQLRRRRAASQRFHEIDAPVPGSATPAGTG
jgi:ribose transport system permease protein